MKVDSLCAILLYVAGHVLAGRENIMTMSRAKSWISDENFTTIIEKSFLYSKCCNIYLSESSHSVEILFKQFIHVYPYEYLLRRAIYDCQGYFLLGPTDKEIEKAMRIVPSSISKTEILIIIDNELEDDSNIFNVSLYGNSNANIVSRSGTWTLSENYLEPRFFLKVDSGSISPAEFSPMMFHCDNSNPIYMSGKKHGKNRVSDDTAVNHCSYEKLMHEFNIINMKGRELEVCTFYRPPVSYLKTTIKKIVNGVEQEVFLVDNGVEMDGIEVKIFLLIAEKLNFTWTLRKPEGEYRYGRRNGSEWNGGIIQLLREKRIHMAFGSIWLTEDTNIFVNMTEPWYQIFIHFLVPRPKPITSFWALTRPFSVEVWMLLVSILLFNSIYMYVRAKLDPKFPKRFRNFVLVITEMIGRLLGMWVPRNTANARLELHLWQTAGVVLVTAYSSSLAVRLASWEYEDRIDTVRQFLEANLSWGREGKAPPFQDYFDLDDPYSGQLPSRYFPVKDKEDIQKFVEKGEYAIFGMIIGSIFFPEDEVINNDFKDYRVMKQMVGSFYSSFAVQPWLLQPVNTVILWLKESGITHFHLGDVIRRRATLSLREVLKEYDGIDGSARDLKLMPLGAGFAVLILGLLISTAVFIYELKQAAGSQPIRDVFREIQKKREILKPVHKRK